jgi:hypothetical protein
MPNFSTLTDAINAANTAVNLSSKPFTFVRREGESVYYRSTDPAIFEADKLLFPPDGYRLIENEFLAIDFLTENVSGYQPVSETPQALGGITNDGSGQTPGALTLIPTDPRLIYSNASEKLVYSFSAEEAKPLVEGFVFPQDAADTQQTGALVSAQNLPEEDIEKRPGVEQFRGVPALMNPNAYIGFQQFKGSKDQDYLAKLMDQENQPRWYEVDQANQQRLHRYKSPSVTEIVAWSQEPDNVNKKPYRFQDFAYCKYWNLVPNNYLITLRRFPFPTSDNLEAEGENNPRNTSGYTPETLRPIAQAVTWLGETTGNKISTILGPIETGLKWKDLTAQVNVVTPGSPGDVEGGGPFPGIASFLGLVSGDYGQTKNATNGQAPPDPYEDGPWNNKIIGHVNVIDSVKARERGLKFTHKIDLVFEYSARSIGGINTKAAMLDIMSNLMMLTTATATFWGGSNRFRPGAPGNTAPFLGGPAGRAAWMRGDVGGFLETVASQFEKAAGAISDFLNAAMEDPIEALKGLAAGGMQLHMKNTTQKGGFASGIKAILTGEPTGEWHLTVGNPFNPMMMIGNLICTGCKFEFSDELGPDDFPTELKATISLEHGRPRDRDAIESMFNGGGGRLYSLPPGYEKTWSSSSQSNVDPFTGGSSNSNGNVGAGGGYGPGGGYNNTLGRNGEGSTGTGSPTPNGNRTRRGILFGDPTDADRGANAAITGAKKVYSEFAAKTGLGYNKKSIA